jgi:hypothetical protein
MNTHIAAALLSLLAFHPDQIEHDFPTAAPGLPNELCQQLIVTIGIAYNRDVRGRDAYIASTYQSAAAP